MINSRKGPRKEMK